MSRDRLFQICAVGLAIFVGWAAFHIIDAPPMTRGEVADWAQGLGSVAAVGIAAWVGTIPIRQQNRDARRARADLISSVVEGAAVMRIRIASLGAAIRRSDAKYVRLELDVYEWGKPTLVLERLLEMPLGGWPSIQLFVRAHDLFIGYQLVIQRCEKYLPVAGTDPGAWASMISAWQVYERADRRLVTLASDMAD